MKHGMVNQTNQVVILVALLLILHGSNVMQIKNGKPHQRI